MRSKRSEASRDIITFNHISNELTESQITELKSYYKTYHKKMWMYKAAYKRLKTWQLAGNIWSVVFATGGLASSIATSGASLLAIASASVLIQAYMKHKNIDIKLYQCQYAYQTYGHLLTEIKNILRSGQFDKAELLSKLQQNDDFILDNSPIVDKFGQKYDKIFM